VTALHHCGGGGVPVSLSNALLHVVTLAHRNISLALRHVALP
jgi:hypothetical protein